MLSVHHCIVWGELFKANRFSFFFPSLLGIFFAGDQAAHPEKFALRDQVQSIGRQVEAFAQGLIEQIHLIADQLR